MPNSYINCPLCGRINIKNDIPRENREYVSCMHCSSKYEERKAPVIRALSENEENEYYMGVVRINTEMPSFIFKKLSADQRDAVNTQNNQRVIDFINKNIV